ncbi:MAG: hypothetical protein KDI17_09045 [Halioglobus sp.]|nr:hypothetical protein [Halioglobus sp.]
MMTPSQIARTAALLFCLPLSAAFAQDNPDADASTNIVEERVTVENGLVEVCGEGDGLDPCLDANGQTYSQEVHGPGIDDESESTLAAEAARIRAESPEELNKTITEMEQGYNPDNSATMGLPH